MQSLPGALTAALHGAQMAPELDQQTLHEAVLGGLATLLRAKVIEACPAGA